MSGLSLWLSPPASSPLQSVLTKLADDFSTVHFSAHATLVSDELVPAGIEVAAIVQQIAEGVRHWRKLEGEAELELKFLDVRQGDKFYQCVLSAVEPSTRLVALHNSLLAAFDLPVPSPPTYFPHVSLVYADLSFLQKVEIIERLQEDGTVVPYEGGVEIAGMRGFTPSEIILVRTSGPPPDWEVLSKIPL